MNPLDTEIRRIISEINAMSPVRGSVEHSALRQLSAFRTAFGAGDEIQQANAFAELHHFWLNVVPWCSQLSKDLEKLIIMIEDL